MQYFEARQRGLEPDGLEIVGLGHGDLIERVGAAAEMIEYTSTALASLSYRLGVDLKTSKPGPKKPRHAKAMYMRGISTLLLSVCLLAGCFLKPHKIDVQQGNYLDEAAVAKLKPGMTRSQVRFLLGTPLIADPFHPERWDYMYLDRKKGKLKSEKRLTLYFDGDKLTRATTDLPEQSAIESNKSAASVR